MRVLTVTDSRGFEHKLVEMRNPWGIEKYQGDWSNVSKLWTVDLLKQADHSLVDDGKYFMSFEDYLTQIEYTALNYDIKGWSHTAFAIFGDDEPVNQQNVFGDGFRYNVHKLYISSPVRQKIIRSTHTYHDKHYHGECNPFNRLTEVLVQSNFDASTLQMINPGTYSEEEIII